MRLHCLRRRTRLRQRPWHGNRGAYPPPRCLRTEPFPITPFGGCTTWCNPLYSIYSLSQHAYQGDSESCGKCPETSTVFAPPTCTLAPNPAQWDMRFLEKPFHTWHPGMTWWKEKPLARWNDAERQSARRGRRVICRL